MVDRKHLENLLQRRDQIKDSISRIKGRLDSARSEQAEIEKECREKGIDPERLDEVVDQLEQRFDQEVEDLQRNIQKAEQDLQPYVREAE